MMPTLGMILNPALAVPSASHLLTWLPSTPNVPSAAEELTFKFRCILNSPDFSLKTDTRFCFWKTLRHVWNKVDM